MNIDISFRKTDLGGDPEVTVRFGSIIKSVKLTAREQVVRLSDVQHFKDNQLIIERDQKDILDSDRTHHNNIVCVDRVTVDDFWNFDTNFHTPTSVLDATYERHLHRVGNIDEITQSLNHNTHLFFNGKLIWDIKYPVRRTFLKDVHI